jgi:hypothetical protein
VHCEFSRERGPALLALIQDFDAFVNKSASKRFPRIRLLEGGYSRFFKAFPELCEGGYVQEQQWGSSETDSRQYLDQIRLRREMIDNACDVFDPNAEEQMTGYVSS